MVFKNSSGLRKLVLMLVTAQTVGVMALVSGPVAAQSTGLYPGTPLSLPVPTAVATAQCTLLASTAPTKGQTIQQTFLDHFTALDLTKTWSPYYDGGYDETTKQFLGYDWAVKRTLSANGEQQVYVDSGYRGSAPGALGLQPFSITRSILHIFAQRTPPELKQYLGNAEFTSGLLTTRRSFAARYGYFEMNAKLPVGAGLWPAFWMLPVNKSWPPELDIMEAPASLPNEVASTVHWKDKNGVHQQSGCHNKLVNPQNDFHLYGVLWTADKIVYYIDRKPVAQLATPNGVNVHMYMLLNLAVGGSWPGMADATTPIPADMQVDWVAAYTTGNPSECGVTANGVKQCPLQ